jgi:signal transduction histidine kinase
MQAVAKNQSYSMHTEGSGTEEIRTLSESFNQMLIDLQFKDKAIADYTDNLEQLVNKRTESLQLALDDAEDANASKSEFLANMSHELRTPLHGILSFSKLGLKKYLTAEPEKLLKYFDRISISGERLLVLLNDLLDLSKLEAGKMNLDKKTNCLYRLAEGCVAELGASFTEKQLDLVWCNKDCNTDAFFDRARIAQVITNLLSNAIKFTPEGKTIKIIFAEIVFLNQPALQLTVDDQGVGIPKDELELVFDKFTQSSKTKTNAGGTGLGLAISKEIILLHGGKLWAESRSDQGASFSFILPVNDINMKL